MEIMFKGAEVNKNTDQYQIVMDNLKPFGLSASQKLLSYAVPQYRFLCAM